MRAHLIAFAAALAVGACAHDGGAPTGPGPNAESGVLAVMRAQGLMGAWAVDCARPAGEGNGWETIVAEGGRVSSTVEAGSTNVYDILAARRLSASDTEMRFRLRGDQSNITVVYRRESDRQVTWSSVDSDGEDLIVEGRFAGGGEMGEWYQRCPTLSGPG